jgi:hypothetical protein
MKNIQLNQPSLKVLSNPVDTINSLESFVSEIVSGKVRLGAGYVSLYQYFELISAYLDAISRLPTQYQYTNNINLFIESCMQLNWIKEMPLESDQTFFKAPTYCVLISEITWDDYCCFLTLVAERGNLELYRNRRTLTKRTIAERIKSCHAYVDALFENTDRLIVLRVDLAYGKDYTCFSSLADTLNDLDHLTSNMANNAIFNELVGYIFKVEYGIEKGMHVHAIFFFNGSKRLGTSHIYHAQQIGEYWVQVITRGKGAYWNCNDQIENFIRLGRCGLGLIHWSDNDLRANLLDIVVHYVCKERQMVKSKIEPNRKMLRKMILPKLPSVKLGRPRHRCI